MLSNQEGNYFEISTNTIIFYGIQFSTCTCLSCTGNVTRHTWLLSMPMRTAPEDVHKRLPRPLPLLSRREEIERHCSQSHWCFNLHRQASKGPLTLELAWTCIVKSFVQSNPRDREKMEKLGGERYQSFVGYELRIARPNGVLVLGTE